MNEENFESQYQKYEQDFIQKARQEFDVQASTNKVQYLRGVYRYLLLNRLLARKQHTVGTVLQDRYHNKLRSSEDVGKIIARYASKLKAHIGSNMFEQMRIDVVRTLYDVFPDETVKGGQYITSAVEGVDSMNHRKFGLRQIRKNTVIEYARRNGIPVRDLKEAQKALAPKMSEIKKKEAQKR